MRYSTWIGVGSVLLLALACTMPWVLIPSKQLVISGIDASGTRYGKPGYLHLLLGFFYLLFTLVPAVWAKRANLLVVAFNLAWTIRNFLILSLCRGGECPQRLYGLYLLAIASILMLIAALLPKKTS
jgi:hypothetical protein